MPRRTQNFFSLARGRVRASMNKYNLFNIYKKPNPRYNTKTHFQQKWLAKQETRAYHGEHLGEKQWKAMFKPNLNSVAQLDASLQGRKIQHTPMAIQTYATLEKRLEFAVFRALFASSIRQAREFIKGGHVKVNGITVRHSSFPLKSGDMFSVEPEKVLFAMGRAKPSLTKAIKTDNSQIHAWNKYVQNAKDHPRDAWEKKQSKPASLNTLDNHVEETKVTAESYNKSLEQQMLEEQRQTTRVSILNGILSAGENKEAEELEAKVFQKVLPNLADAEKALNAYTLLKKEKHPLVETHSAEACEKYISTKSTEYETPAAAKLASQVKKILSEVLNLHLEYLRVTCEKNKLKAGQEMDSFASFKPEKMRKHKPLSKEEVLEDESKALVNLPWQKGLFGRQDATKPYFTPWTPRPFLGAFAVLPHHLEVSYETCHAIYLNDPVARPGQSEVISPFPLPTHERAFLFYSRKGM